MLINVRKGTETDSEVILRFTKKLAEFENLNCGLTEERLIELMSEPNGLCALIAEADGVPIGVMTYYFYKIATFAGKRVLYIEDVYIEEKFRDCGVGTKLFEKIKSIAGESDCARLEWKCLDWNTNAQNFYNKIGGKISDKGWLTYTIDKDNF